MLKWIFQKNSGDQQGVSIGMQLSAYNTISNHGFSDSSHRLLRELNLVEH